MKMKEKEALEFYGRNLGLTFQIADDILDFTGDAQTMGKPVGHDLHEDKITLPLIHALKAAPEEERTSIEDLLQQQHKGDAQYRQLVAFVEEYEGVATANKCAREYATRAQECLKVLNPSPARTALELAVRLVVERNN